MNFQEAYTDELMKPRFIVQPGDMEFHSVGELDCIVPSILTIMGIVNTMETPVQGRYGVGQYKPTRKIKTESTTAKL